MSSWSSIINEGDATMLPKNRRPTTPGEILKYEFIEPLGLTQQQLAERLGITRVRVNEIISGKRAITPDTAIRLSRLFHTTVEFWMGLQTDVELWDAMKAGEREYRKIIPLKPKKIDRELSNEKD
jgi:addiction module HigA family antidote